MMGGSLPRSDGHRRSIGVGAVPARGSSDPSYGVVLGVVAATFVALGVLFLFPYLQRHFRYPIGWGAPGYVAKAADVKGNGLVLSGTIRVGGSLLLAVLMSATGQSAFTLVAIVPAMLTAIAGLGAVAMVRGPFEMRPIWVPVIAFLAWAGFVRNYILNFHLDNLVNASLVLPAFAAAIVFASRRKGALAATILFMAAGLAHWPFFAFAIVVFVLALAGYIWLPVGASRAGWPGRLKEMAPLLAAAGVSGGFVLLTLLAVPPTGWRGARVGKISLKLRARFTATLRDPATYYSMPLGVVGAIVAIRSSSPAHGDRAGRRLFLCLMAAWVSATVAGGLAQLLSISTAGERLILFFFPMTILSGLVVWWAARWLGSHPARGAGRAAGIVLVAGAVAILGGLTAKWWAGVRPAIDARTVQEATFAGEYLDQTARGRQAVFILTESIRTPAWQSIAAALPPDEHARTFPYYGSLAHFLIGRPSKRVFSIPPPPALSFGPSQSSLRPGAVAIVIERFNARVFRKVGSRSPERVIASGVLIARGPLPRLPLPGPRLATANVCPAGLVG